LGSGYLTVSCFSDGRMRSSRTFNVDDFAAKLGDARQNLQGGSSGRNGSAGGGQAPAKNPTEGAAAAAAAATAAGAAAGAWLSRLGGSLAPNLKGAANDLGLGDVASAAEKGVQNVAAMGGRAKTLAKSASTTISENAISRQRWMSFFGGIALGTGLISLAFMFLPMIVLMPQKFALLFTLGSVSFMSSFSILRGHAAFARHLLSRSRVLFSAMYVTSMVGTLWASLVYRSYILTVCFAVIQVVALSWFLVSYIPGGRRALSFATGIAWKVVRGCCQCASKGSILPF